MAKKSKIAPEDLAKKKAIFEKVADNLEEISSESFLKSNFLPYSWSYNLDRALVDVSGLKPVQRRVLWTMFENNLSPNSSRKKVASLAGAVLRYHPHGDASVAEALKNLAKPYIFRVPLVDGKGNYGSPGTQASAGRYLEARLNKAAWINIEDVSEEAVRMVPSYDNDSVEPVKIPVKWPVAVVNGGSGMAIGYAANIPSHNPTEIMKACIALAENPEIDEKKFLKIIKGPDFNMGGTITSREGVEEYLTTGKGSFKIRANYEVTEKPRKAFRIEFYEIPFGTSPEGILQDIQKAIDSKGLFKELASFKDLSDLKHSIRIVVETKTGVNEKKIIQELFKNTSLEKSFSANMTTLVDNRPELSGIKVLLEDFLNFRRECIKNKSAYQLKKKSARLNLLEGLFKVLVDIDKAIAIIRGAEDSSVASQELMSVFGVNKEQADYILSLQLRRLTKMDSLQLKKEKEAIEQTVEYLNDLLSNDETLKDFLIKELNETMKIIGDKRKTDINTMTEEELKEHEKEVAKALRMSEKNTPCKINLYSDGKILLVDESKDKDPEDEAYSTNGPLLDSVKVMSQEEFILVSSDGNGYRVPVSYVSSSKPSALTSVVTDADEKSKIVGISKAGTGSRDIGLAMGTSKGFVKICKTDFPAGESFPVIKLADDDFIVGAKWITGSLNKVVMGFGSSDSNVLLFSADQVRATGHKAGGIKGMGLKEGQKVVAFNVFSLNDEMPSVLTKTEKTFKMTPVDQIPIKNKGGQGVLSHAFRKGETKVTDMFIGTDPVAIMSGTENTINLPAPTKRFSSGSDMTLPVELGSKNI